MLLSQRWVTECCYWSRHGANAAPAKGIPGHIFSKRKVINQINLGSLHVSQRSAKYKHDIWLIWHVSYWWKHANSRHQTVFHPTVFRQLYRCPKGLPWSPMLFRGWESSNIQNGASLTVIKHLCTSSEPVTIVTSASQGMMYLPPRPDPGHFSRSLRCSWHCQPTQESSSEGSRSSTSSMLPWLW